MEIWFIIYALATYRLTHFIVFDMLPEPIREWVGVVIAEDFSATGESIAEYRTVDSEARFPKLAEFLNCHYCVSFWVSVLFSSIMIWHLSLPLIAWPVLSFAFSAVSTVIETIRMSRILQSRILWWK